MKAIVPLSKTQKALIRQEAKEEAWRQVYAARDRLFNDMDAVILWMLHDQFGFGEKRLKQFYVGFVERYKELQQFYELGNDTPFVCKTKLKEIGIDVDEWAREVYGS